MSSARYPTQHVLFRRPELPLWIAGTILASVFAVDGLLQLAGRSAFVPLTLVQGLPEWLQPAVAAVEIVSAVGLLVPAVISVAAVVLGLTMAGGAVAHLQAGNGLLAVAPLFLCAALAIIGYQLSPRVKTLRRLRSALNAFAESEIRRDEIRRGSLPRKPATSGSRAD